jgi:hypothetical protein
VIPPGIPGELVDESMILMTVVAIVREDQIRRNFAFEFLEDIFDLAS